MMPLIYEFELPQKYAKTLSVDAFVKSIEKHTGLNIKCEKVMVKHKKEDRTFTYLPTYVINSSDEAFEDVDVSVHNGWLRCTRVHGEDYLSVAILNLCCDIVSGYDGEVCIGFNHKVRISVSDSKLSIFQKLGLSESDYRLALKKYPPLGQGLPKKR